MPDHPLPLEEEEISWMSLFRSFAAIIALIVMTVLLVEHHDHSALFAALIALLNIGGEVFG